MWWWKMWRRDQEATENGTTVIVFGWRKLSHNLSTIDKIKTTYWLDTTTCKICYLANCGCFSYSHMYNIMIKWWCSRGNICTYYEVRKDRCFTLSQEFVLQEWQCVIQCLLLWVSVPLDITRAAPRYHIYILFYFWLFINRKVKIGF